MRYSITLFVIFSFVLIFNASAGSGTQTDPFTVAQAIAKSDNSAQTYWVKGYVVGEMSDFSNNKYFYELAPPFSGTSAYLIADNPDEVNLAKCMPVQLGTERSSSMNLDEFPQFWRKEVITCGLLRDYFAMPGLKTLSSLEVVSQQPLTNEAANWNFFEDMDGDYEPASASSIFAGGTYSGETGDWKLYGATWGESSNDKKWGKASARLRLSEASTGNAGYMQMEADKANGAGTIRFWAGYYDTDNGGAIAIQVSTDGGKNWETKIASQAIAKDWKEYQFKLDVSGNVRVRIMKAENGSAGINIDKIKISDYYGTTALNVTKNPSIDYYSTSNGIVLKLGNTASTLMIYNITGQEIYRNASIAGTQLIKLKTGIYFVKINNKSYKVICK